MKLILEDIEDVKYITEKREDGKKNLYIEGIFMQGGIKNRNGRIYPVDVLVNEANRYAKSLVEAKRAYGELGHPNGPTINLDRVSHRIVELRQVDTSGNIYGKAQILDTPMGNIARGIIESGGSLGVSSRGMGSIKESNGIKEVQSDFFLATAADIVADPSAPDAFVQGIMEGVDWVWDNGILKAQQIAAQAKIEINEASSSKVLTGDRKLEIFEAFLTRLVQK
jgi:hypothetical protein